MNNKIKKILSGSNKNAIGMILCVVAIIIALIIFLISRGSGSSKNKSSEEEVMTTPAEAYSQIGDSDIKNVSSDGDENKPWETMEDDTYSIKMNILAGGYTGKFVEDGSDEDVKDVLAIEFINNGSQDIQYAEYVFGINNVPVSFKLSDLPAGQRCVVLESARHEYKKKEVLSLVSRVVAQVDEIPFARDEVMVVDNSDNTITIMNLTDKKIPVARAFYKNYDDEEGIFLGGITYTTKVENIPAGKGITVEPAHYVSGKSVVVGTGVYKADSE